MLRSRSSAFETQPFTLIARSVSSGTTTKRDPRGTLPLYGSTGQIGRTDRIEFTGRSILIARVGANAGSVYTVDGSYGVTDNTLVVRLHPGHSYSFVTQLLQYADLNRMVYGSGQPLVTGTMIKSLEVPTTSPDEQARIAAALDDANAYISKLRRLIGKRQAIKQGMMQQLLTGRTRLPGFSDKWQPRTLGDLLAYEQPGRYLVSSTDYVDTGTPVLTAGRTFLLGHTTDRHGIFQDVPVIIFDDFTTASKFVDFLFKAKSSAMKMLSARPGVNLRYVFERMQLVDFVAVDHKRRWITEFSKIELSVPERDEQDYIAAVLEDADSQIAVLEQRFDKAIDIKLGLMQQLLTGRTRLSIAESAA